MNRHIALIFLALLLTVSTQAQKHIFHEYNNVSLSDALSQLAKQQTDYVIMFLYNELEDFRITTTVRHKTLPDAIQQMIAFYPIRMTVDESNTKEKKIFVECTHKTDRHLTGTIIDEQGHPVAYANVAIFNPVDSTLCGGGVSNESGYFAIPYEQSSVLARISYIGFKTIYKFCDHPQIGKIRMQPDKYTLKGVTVKGERPLYQTKGGSIVTNVAGTVLERLHNANELLMQVPGVVCAPDGTLTVFGRGTPIYYINNRKVQNIQEITRLSPKDIQNIELVRNPGAQYDADVTAVIKITTRIKEEGYTLQIKANEKQNDVLTSDESLDVGLKQGGLNASMHLEYEDFRCHYNQPQIEELVVDGDIYRYDKTQNYSKSHQKSPSWSANVDYEFNERHIAGVSYDGYHNTWVSPGDALHIYSKNGLEFQRTHILSDYHNDMDYAHINTFYNAEWTNRLRTALNLDYVGNSNNYRQLTDETTDNVTCSTLNRSKNHYHIYAGRLTFDYTFGQKSSLSWGAEYNRVTGSGTADCSNVILKPSDYGQWENKAAVFVETKTAFGDWTLSGGLRYEDVTSDYADRQAPDVDIYRHYHNLFPSVKVCHKDRGWMNTLSFSSHTSRPSLRQLSNYTYYDSELAYQHGNPSLQPMTFYTVEWSTGYKFINASLSYIYKDNLIAPDMYTENEHSRILVSSYSNFDHASLLGANVSLQHNFRWWRPSLSMAVEHLFFDYEYMNEPYSYGKTKFYIIANQYFDLPKSWLANIYYYYDSGGTQNNIQLKPYQMLNLSLQKSFLQDRLSVKLAARDLFHKMKFEENERIRNVHFWQIEDYRDWNFSFSIVYRLNQLKTKYRGKSAANEQINRL